MKQGLTLQQLAAEVERQAKTKADYVADTRRFGFHSNGTSTITVDGVGEDGSLGEFEVGDIAHGQIAQRLGIPKKYYDRMRSTHPELLDQNVLAWFGKEPEKRMLRTLDGKARAFLSDRYRRIDNIDIAKIVLPIIGELDGNVASSALTDKKMYVKVEFPSVEAPVKGSKRGVGDIIRSGLMFENSEVGHGAFSIRPYFVALICSNGMVADRYGLRQYHVGSRIEDTADAYELFSDDTLKADDEAFALKIRDVTRSVVDQTKFEQIVAEMSELTEIRVEGDPVGVVEKLENRFDLTEQERGSVLSHLIEGGDLSAWGVVNAFTRASQDVEDYDRATEFEEIGGTLAGMERREVAALLAA